MVQIDIEQGMAGLALANAFKRSVKAVQQFASIEQAGHRIVTAQVIQVIAGSHPVCDVLCNMDGADRMALGITQPLIANFKNR